MPISSAVITSVMASLSRLRSSDLRKLARMPVTVTVSSCLVSVPEELLSWESAQARWLE